MVSTKPINNHFPKKIPKILIYVLQLNSNDERCFRKAKKPANLEFIRFHHFKFQIPTA